MEQCGAGQQVAVNTCVLLCEALAERGYTHGVFQKAAQISVVELFGRRCQGEPLEEDRIVKNGMQ